jgi:hypothetical protein
MNSSGIHDSRLSCDSLKCLAQPQSVTYAYGIQAMRTRKVIKTGDQKVQRKFSIILSAPAKLWWELGQDYAGYSKL